MGPSIIFIDDFDDFGSNREAVGEEEWWPLKSESVFEWSKCSARGANVNWSNYVLHVGALE